MKNTKIEWTDHTFNPWIGCTKVSPGCANCYAESQDLRWGHDSWGQGKPRRRTSAGNWKQPLAWNRAVHQRVLSAMHQVRHFGDDHYKADRPRVFCASLADWLDHEVQTAWRVDLLALIEATQNLDWLLLTKRPESWNARLHEAMGAGSSLALRWLNGTPPANVWIGTTVEDQQHADERIPHLLRVPARVRFLSCEPLLGPVDLRPHIGLIGGAARDLAVVQGIPLIHWVICGGESGPKARPMHPDWARSLRDQCAAAGVPFFFKQWGEWTPGENLTRGGRLRTATLFADSWDYSTQTDKQSENCHVDDSPDLYHVGKHAAGRLLDGREHNEFPQ